MDYSKYAKYCRLIGYRVEESSQGIWIGISHGFFNRVPLYETAPPTEEEMRCLLRRYPILGLHYALEPSGRGKPSHVFFVRGPDYGLKDLRPKMRTRVRRGLENCQLRQMSFDALQRLAMPLNRDTLARQGRDDPTFSDPERWTRFCHAGRQFEGAQVWGAFFGDELAAYAVVFQLGDVVNLMYQMSSTSLLHSNANPALDFGLTQTMLSSPDVQAVYFGPGGQWSSQGLDDYKRRLGFAKEPVVFAARLRPVMRRALFDLGGRRIINAFGRWLSHKDLYQNVQAVLDVAAQSAQGSSAGQRYRGFKDA
jgi:hypothetical protein